MYGEGERDGAKRERREVSSLRESAPRACFCWRFLLAEVMVLRQGSLLRDERGRGRERAIESCKLLSE